jgi:hypothetical protein
VNDESHTLDGVAPETPDSRRSASGVPLIFFCDVSAEAHRLTALLRERGYDVVEVPVGMLVGRVRVQMPDLILCDVDEDGALDAAHRLRDVPGGSGVDVVFIGDPGKTEQAERDALEHEASGLFLRPVDGHTLIGKVEALIGPGPGPGSHRPPQPGPRPSRLPLAPDSSVPPPKVLESALHGDGTPEAAMPPALAESDQSSEAQQSGAQSSLSDAVTDLLERAEARIGSATDDDRRSPRDEVQSILPDELLKSLDETLDADAELEDNERASRPPQTAGDIETEGPGTGSRATGTSITGEDSASWNADQGETRQTSVTGGRTGATSADAEPVEAPRPEAAPRTPAPNLELNAPPRAPNEPDEPDEPDAPHAQDSSPARSSHPSTVPPGPRARAARQSVPIVELASAPHGARPGASGVAPRETLSAQQQPPFAHDGHRNEPVNPSPESVQPAQIGSVGAPAATAPTWAGPSSATVGPGDVPREFGRAVRERFTGALAIEAHESVRRVVLHDGDVVTVASSAENESLVAFLVARGSLREEVGQALSRRIPRFGRHAVAALIANGQLAQDQLWPILRAHAEWLLTTVLRVEVGIISVEPDLPASLASEPSVFGGGTGAEAFIDGVLRAFSPAESTRRLGGAGATFEQGPAAFLLNECGLNEGQRASIESIEVGSRPRLADGARSEDANANANSTEAPLFYALTLLGVVQVARTHGRERAGSPRHAPQPPKALDSVALDAAAVRERIAARLALVQEGDYYAVLGVARGATEHEIRHAHEGLREELDPARVITGRTADLADDLDLVLEVVDEAYEILSDPTRRDRYLAAIEATPRTR